MGHFRKRQGYFAKDPYVAESYCEAAEDVEESTYNSGIVILCVESSCLDNRLLGIDNNVRNGSTITYAGKKLNIPEEFFELLKEDTPNGKIILRSEDGTVYQECDTPAVLYDAEDNVMLKIGDKENVEEWMKGYVERLGGFGGGMASKMAQNITILVLPRNQQLFDKIFQCTGYLGLYIKRCKQLY